VASYKYKTASVTAHSKVGDIGNILHKWQKWFHFAFKLLR